MSQEQRGDVTPMPKVLPRKSFFSLPLAQQGVVYGLLLLLLVALLPAVLDTRRLGRGSFRSALARPTSTAQAIERVVAFYSPSGLAQALAQPSRRNLFLLLLALIGGLSYAGSAAQRPAGKMVHKPRCFGAQATIRARAALANQERE
jgi:hypothetical protein